MLNNNIINFFKNIFNQKNKWTYIYLDSTLPFAILNKKENKKNIIFIARKKHLIKILNKFYIKNNKSINVSSFMSLRLIYILIKIKIFDERIVFFHECCNPLFDTLINLLKIKGFYFPIAKPLKIEKGLKYSAYKVKSLSIKKKIIYFFLECILKNFQFYIRKGHQEIPVLYFVIKKYHQGVKIQRKNFNNKIKFIKSKKPLNKVLIFLSKVPSFNKKDFNQKMLDCFDTIIDFCKKKKITVYVKNHPHKTSRLRLKNKNFITINPYKPAELIPYNKFDLFISLTSNSLCSFDKKAISVTNLITNNTKAVKYLKQPFLNRGFKEIKYPKTYDELFKTIIKACVY